MSDRKKKDLTVNEKDEWEDLGQNKLQPTKNLSSSSDDNIKTSKVSWSDYLFMYSVWLKQKIVWGV